MAVISPLQNNRYSVKNSRVFAERIREQTLEPDEIFVSFDVVSLFTCNRPTHLALRITSERLHEDSTLCARTNLSSDKVMRLLEFVLNNVYLTFQGTHYQQVFGCPKGSPMNVACERRRISGGHFSLPKETTAGNTSAFAGYHECHSREFSYGAHRREGTRNRLSPT